MQARNGSLVRLPAIQHGAPSPAPIGIVGDRLVAKALTQVLDHGAMHRQKLNAIVWLTLLERRRTLVFGIEPASTLHTHEVVLARHVEHHMEVAPVVALKELMHHARSLRRRRSVVGNARSVRL